MGQGAVSLTGNDTTLIDSQIITDLGDGDVGVLEFPDDLVGIKVGKNGNTLYSFNASGLRVVLTLRVIAGSADDKYLNSRLAQQINDFPSFVLMSGEFIKRVGDGAGNISSVTYVCQGGVVQKVPVSKENVEGNNDQAIAEWKIVFGNGGRAIA